MGRKKQGKFVRPDNKGKDKRHKMKGKSVEAFTEELHSTFEGNAYTICNTNIHFNCSTALYSTFGWTTEILNGSKVFLT